MALVPILNEEQLLDKQPNQITKELLLVILADKHSRKIIESTIESPRLAMDFANNFGVPLNTAYRRLKMLEKCKILKISGIITDDGRKAFLYQSRIRVIKVNCIGNSCEVEIIPNDLIDNTRDFSLQKSTL